MSLKSPWHKLRNKATVRSPNPEPNEDEDWYAEDDEPVLQRESGRKRKPDRRRAYVAALAAALVLILGTAAVTYSYLMASSDVVVNTFAGGAISLTLDEAKVDTDGNPLDDEPRVQENTYKVVPGTTLYKDPTVTVLEGSEVCYVFLYVENPLDEDYFTFDYSSDWIEVATTGTKTLYVYKTTVDASDGDVVLTPIFTTITVNSPVMLRRMERGDEIRLKNREKRIRRAGREYFAAILMLACLIALCPRVGTTYAVITQATNVAVNTFYGESETGETGDTGASGDTEDTAESETDASATDESEVLDADRPGTDGTDTDDTGATQGEGREPTEDDSGTDVRGAERTGDDSNILIWILIAAAALAAIAVTAARLRKKRKDETETESKQ